ncbi:FKBP-type peptidyl-prolyl cis-trans isomerase [Alteromonas gilva]|uniref:Peptidyl-prolyl cis-trans isomerase n=1 Tax=Alteromonas gilva TaxID=2987522 RepID=A0ABT5KY38_9ALTE|nr:FKBP-type peptidyl-prolyl cis-trans isomerase [Alteromonas gilva]MDC8829685.1 FKBP-type peptidyl-prolyl cis-trans isomerase [Alteromonas gilva]
MAKRKQSKGSRGSNKNLSEEVIAKFQQRADVTATASGLLYRVIEQADGVVPGMQDNVKVHQRIKLGDGSVIDDTYKKGLPEEYAVSEAIEGLQEGFQLMNTGARFEFVIPPELAWGKRGNSGAIGPNAVMIVDVRLVAVE